MADSPVPGIEMAESLPKFSEWKRFSRVFLGRGVVKVGLFILAVFIILAVFAPLIAPYDPYYTDEEAFLAHPSSAHWLGTDVVGRDILSRVIYGTRTSLEIGLIVVFVSGVIGMALGTIAGYYGGLIQNIIMRFVDALMSFPMILLALVIAALLGGGLKNMIIALSVAMMPNYARVMYAQVLSVKESDYVVASHSLGSTDLRVMVRHIVPNCLSPLIVMFTMMLGSVIMAEAGLSFLGIGINPPIAAWGSMISDGRYHLLSSPILSFAPGVALMLAVFAFNMVGDGLRDAIDPKLRGTF
jgi:peptide/nickel transport system permease protein